MVPILPPQPLDKGFYIFYALLLLGCIYHWIKIIKIFLSYSTYLGHLIAYHRISTEAIIDESIIIIKKAGSSCPIARRITNWKILKIVKIAPKTMFVIRLALLPKLTVRNARTKGTSQRLVQNTRFPEVIPASPDIIFSI